VLSMTLNKVYTLIAAQNSLIRQQGFCICGSGVRGDVCRQKVCKYTESVSHSCLVNFLTYILFQYPSETISGLLENNFKLPANKWAFYKQPIGWL
ncbi:MAG: hypothetical protein K2I11_09030, partial [Bacteroides sp.]|nr:hypothetical protein [Bacteroides sp.]